MKFLVIEDDDLSRMGLAMMLKDLGEVTEASNVNDARQAIESGEFDISFIDLDLEVELAGFELIKKVVEKKGHAVVISGREEEQYIEKAYNLGCLDYLGKPFKRDGLELVLRRYDFLKKQGVLKDFFTYDYITSDDSIMEDLGVLEDIVISAKPVFLQGDTGTGKTMMAKLIHSLTCTKEDEFVHLNCAEIPENLLESELFGYEKGAFTGADKSKLGKLALADGGTLFLDEIATLPIVLQKKLLKVIEEKTYYPLGSTILKHSNFRLITATCENLKEMIEDNKFRKDLYYRIYGYNIFLKPLKDRAQDILLLVKHFLRKGQRRIVLSKEVKNAFEKYSWPGNIRELKKIVEILQAKSFGIIQLADLPTEISSINPDSDANEVVEHLEIESKSSEYNLLNSEVVHLYKTLGLKAVVEKIEYQIVNREFINQDEKVRPTLDALKISSSAFYRILKKEDIL